MIKNKRAFLSLFFQREYKIMLKFYNGKKKLKKTLTKLQSLKPANLENVIDCYFNDVCYGFFKRQMLIWILLKHKYLRTSAVDINARRFIFNDGQSIASSANNTVTDATNETKIDEEKKQIVEEDKFPVYFSAKESEPINKLTKEIMQKVEYLLKGTIDAPAVGNLADNVRLPTSTDPRLNMPYALPRQKSGEIIEIITEPVKKSSLQYYAEKGLVSEKTSILKKIATAVGLQVEKKSKKDTGKSGTGKGKGKTSISKKRTGQTAAMDMAAAMVNQQITISEPVPEPIFRYVPDRDTIQRLILRCTNMMSDLSDLGLDQEN
jgi:hypothetical protein